MGANKRVIFIGIILGLIAWVGNFFYYYIEALPQPIFIRQYSEASFIDGTEKIRIDYITQDKKATIHSVMFEELSDSYIAVEDEKRGSVGRDFRRQISFNVDRFFLDTNHLEDWWLHQSRKGEGLKVTKMMAYFTDGTAMEVDLGEIYLLPLPQKALEAKSLEEARELVYKNPGFIDFSISQSSNNGSGKVIGYATKDMMMHRPTSYVDEKVLEVFDVYINGLAIANITYPLNIKKGERLEVNYKKKTQELTLPVTKIVSYLTFHLEDNEGNKDYFTQRIDDLEWGIPIEERQYIKKIKESRAK